jgi:predicted permease
MSTLSEWMNRLRYLKRRSRIDDDLQVEVQFHIESRTADLIAAGLSPRDAVTRARAEFGSIACAVEESRAAWQFRWIEDLVRDLCYGVRTFRRSPGFAVTAIVSLALGLGTNAAIFNALYTILWKPLPVSRPEGLVKVSIESAKTGLKDVPPVAFLRQLRSATGFEGVFVTSTDGLSFSYDGRAERVMGEGVSGSYFAVLGVRPIIGQPFTSDVRRGNWAPEAVLSYGFWQRRFAGDPGVIGRAVQLNTYPFTIVGVSPPGFLGLERGTDVDLRIPMMPDGRELAQITRISARPDRGMFTIARLKPGSSRGQAEASADVQLQEFLRTTTIPRFKDRAGHYITLTPVGNGDLGVLGQLRTPLYVVFVLVALVLLIACANLANMLLARAAVRARELAVRRSIGAGRLRLIRQMLAESLLLSLVAGAFAVAIGRWVAGALVHFVPQGHVATVLDLRMDPVTGIFVFALSLVACVTFGLAPAIDTTRGDLGGILKADSSASIGNPSSGWFRKVLVVSQVAFSLVLLIAAGIFLRTLLNLWPKDYGADPGRVVLFTMKPQGEIYTPVQRRTLIAKLVRRVSDIPGVEAAGVAEYGPLGSRVSESRESIEAEPGHPVRAQTDWVSEGFFDAVGLPRIAGRDFTESDSVGSSLVVIINQSLGQELFGNTNPVGRIVRPTQDKDARALEIVGVVGDSRYYGIHGAPQPAVWFPFQDAAPYMPTLHVRSGGMNTDAMAAAVRRELDRLDKGFPIFDIKTLEVRFEESLARERILAALSGGVGLLALALAAVGLYGILTYSVSRQTREIGIRMALGSSAPAVLWLVVREALLVIGVGSLAGLTLSVAGWRLLSERIPGVSQIDAQVLIVCAVIMLILAATAVSVPAIRACRIDPLIALRHE